MGWIAGFPFPARFIFCTPPLPVCLWGPPFLQSNGYRNIFPRLKRPGLEAGHHLHLELMLGKVEIYLLSIGFEVLTAVSMKMAVFIPPLPHSSSWRGS
jgi:hypothetical protein